MKKTLFIVLALLALISLAPAENMSAGAGYYMGTGRTEGESFNAYGAFFQYDFQNWLGARANLGSMSEELYLKNSYPFSITDQTETYTEEYENDLTVDNKYSGFYFGANLLGQLKSDAGTFYFGPGFYTYSFTGTSSYTLETKETDTYSGGGSQVYTSKIEDSGDITGSDSGLTLLVGGKAKITDMVFVFGEAMYMSSLKGKYTDDWTGTETDTETGMDPWTTSREGKTELTYNKPMLNFGFGIGISL